MKFKGEVIKKLSGQGSKSEHMAIFLKIDKDDSPISQSEFLLRRNIGNPFQDKVLEDLVGNMLYAMEIL